MSKREYKRRDRKRKKMSKRKTSISLREMFAASLHRRLCLWDVLIHELATVLFIRCRQMSNRLSADTFRFNNADSMTVGWMLARGFEILISRNWPAGLAEGLWEKLWQLDEASAETIAEGAASQCFAPLLRKYVEDKRDIYPGRPHRDLCKLTTDLSEALKYFLVSRCTPGGDLYKCLKNPLADHNRYLHNNGRSAEPTSSCGDPIHDIYRLGLTIHEEDDGGDIKWKLIHFVRNDPWLFAECKSFVQQRLDEIENKERPNDMASDVDQTTDEFIFRATHLAGKTPIHLFIERQKDMSERQRERLLRWDTETFYGTFIVNDTEFPFINAIDIPTDKSYRLTATLPEALRSLKKGDLFFSRVTPWDDHWLLSGIQQKYEGAGKDQKLVSDLKHEAQLKPMHRPGDGQDPRIQEGFKVQEAQHQAWIDLYGQEELLFEDGLALGAAMNRFHRYWMDEILFGDTGMSRAQLYRQRHGQPPPNVKFPHPDYLLEAKDTAAVFDRRHGLAFYIGYGLFQSAFEQQGPLSDKQIQRVWDYLIDESTDYWLFQRMRNRFPEQTEYVFREVLKDKYFQLDRDFEAALRKFKGQAMRRPVRPMITVVDTDTDSKSIRKVLK